MLPYLLALLLVPARPQRFVDIYTNHPDEADVLKAYDGIRRPQRYLYPKSYGRDFSRFEENLVKQDLQSEYGEFDDDQFDLPFKTRPKFYTKNRTSIPSDGAAEDASASASSVRLQHLLDRYLEQMHKKKPPDEATAPPAAEDLYELVDRVNKSKLLLDPAQLLMFKNSSKFMTNKFLSLFTIVKFPNAPCVGTDGISGVCYYKTECQNMNGTAMGSCANGYGVCCVFTATCGATSNKNCTYFQSPNYPNYYPTNGTVVPPPAGGGGTIDPRLRYQLMMYLARQASTTDSLACIFQMMKSSSSVRQFRVDFIDFELKGPTNGTCVAERLVITGQNSNDIIPAICGYNTGQHMYIDVSDVTGPVQFAVLSSAVERKRFRMRICQIDSCSSPQNCLQYYTGVRGVISSFNYDQAASLSRSMPGYFNNLNYAICIRKEAGYCTITYTNEANGTTYPFALRNVDEAGLPTVPPGQAGAEIFSCPDDYIVIDGLRLCGERLNDGSIVSDFTENAPVVDLSLGPFIIPVRTDMTVTARGFKLFYTQNRCPNS